MREEDLEREELMLRRRLLFRLLRGHRFDSAARHGEPVAELVRSGMIAPGRGLFDAAAGRPPRAGAAAP